MTRHERAQAIARAMRTLDDIYGPQVREGVMEITYHREGRCPCGQWHRTGDLAIGCQRLNPVRLLRDTA